jgi:hypothetical protein
VGLWGGPLLLCQAQALLLLLLLLLLPLWLVQSCTRALLRPPLPLLLQLLLVSSPLSPLCLLLLPWRLLPAARAAAMATATTAQPAAGR